MIRLPALAIGTIFIMGPGAASAATACPVDLPGIAQRIQTPELRANLNIPMSNIIADAGDVDQAIVKTEARLRALIGRETQYNQSVQSGAQPLNPLISQAFSDGKVFFEAEVAALKCLKAAN